MDRLDALCPGIGTIPDWIPRDHRGPEQNRQYTKLYRMAWKRNNAASGWRVFNRFGVRAWETML